MAVAEKLSYLNETKKQIKSALQSKGVSVSDSDTFRSYADKINQISSDGQLPDFMSARNFTFDGNKCVGYVGDNSLPEIIIPKSYSIDDGGNFIDGNDYQVTEVASSDGSHSGFSAFTGKIIVPKGITKLSRAVFYSCDAQTIILPSGLDVYDTRVEIPTLSFQNSYINHIDIPDGVQVIGVSAFQDCGSLRSIILPNSLEVISQNGFYGCGSLEYINIPLNVIGIGQNAFSLCNMLKYVRLMPTTPPTLSNRQALPSSIERIEVPSESLSAYQTATNWSNHANKMVGV